MYLDAAACRAQKSEDPFIRSEKLNQEKNCDCGKSEKVCAHCGSKKHGDCVY